MFRIKVTTGCESYLRPVKRQALVRSRLSLALTVSQQMDRTAGGVPKNQQAKPEKETQGGARHIPG